MVAMGSNNLVLGRSMDNVMRDLTRFKAQDMAISWRHNTEPSTFAVCTLPHPPAHTKYSIDDHQAGLSGTPFRSIPSHHGSDKWREQVKEEMNT